VDRLRPLSDHFTEHVRRSTSADGFRSRPRQYEAAFRDNAIDMKAPADLTEGDLERLGLALGDRKRLLGESCGFWRPGLAE
jgi:hypothetical protein